MNANKRTAESIQQKPLRLWPGVVIVTLQWLARFVVPIFVSGDIVTQLGVFAGLLGGLAVVVWWVFFSRAPRSERWGAIILIIVAMIIASRFLDESIHTAMMGLMFIIYSIPVMSLAFVVWAVASSHLSNRLRRATMVATILLASGVWILLRTDGMNGSAQHDFAWRWAETSEERLLAQAGNKQIAMPLDSTSMATEAEWPGFRGRNRDGIIHTVKINTDWSKSSPIEMWRKSIGPGCSSFAIHGSLIYTQEQRGEFELVTCYNLNTGEPVWKYSDKARFWDSHAGAGPRSTPTLHNGCVYTLGATGILNKLDERNGSVLWSRNAASDTGVEVLSWGFTGSPLVVDDIVIVSLSGKLAAYDAANGNPKWSGSDGGNSYSSPHLVTIDGVSQVLLMSKSGALSVNPVDGKQLWKYEWPIEDRILQPAVIAEGDLLFAGEMKGLRRVNVSQKKGEWTVKELWNSDEMILNFNDIVIHKGYAYGFDGPSIACIDIKDGKRMWKGNPYRGWLLLLADQDLLLVLSEKGELAIVDANPAKFTKLGQIPAIKGKTWNHPAMAGNVVVVRNNQEMAAFRLPLLGE
jgi:outer membrane protein assembly factor BamB